MATPFDAFTRQKEFLVCVDSDGCAMDTMDIKHFRCFGPCMVKEWGLEAWEAPILQRWNEINLYTMTRGVNRFKGLAMALEEIDAQYRKIDGLAALKAWAAEAKELSNGALERALAAGADPILGKALAWSQAVNAAITQLPEELKQPFAGAKEGLEYAHRTADVAIVSSANRDAVLAEWEVHGLLPHTDIVLAQDAGSKAHCIGELLKKGYDPAHVLMVGDAPGDKAAAEKNGVYFYPILVRHEAESWAEFVREGLAHLEDGTYAGYGEAKAAQFTRNLGGK